MAALPVPNVADDCNTVEESDACDLLGRIRIWPG